MADSRNTAELTRFGAERATEAQLTAALQEMAPREAEEMLSQLAAALFPGGVADISQLTWRDAGAAAADGHGGGPASDSDVRLRTAELRYRTLIEQIPAVTFMAALGEGDNEMYVSPHIEALLGFTQKEWLEDPFLWYTQLHPDDRELWHQEFARGCRTGGPFRAECRFIARDGRTVWVHGEARLVKDEFGRPLFLQGVAFDITEAKRTHARILREVVRTTEERYRDLVEQLGAIFWEADRSTPGFTFVSRGAERLLGYERERWLAEPDFWLRFVHPEDRDAAAAAWARARQPGAGSSEFEFRALTADGRTVWLQQTVHTHDDGSGHSPVLGVILDVTDRKRTEEVLRANEAAAERAREAAEAANRAKDEFLATMSHELRTPLNAILGWAMILRTNDDDQQMRHRAIETIERNARAQTQIIEDLLDVSRIVTGKLRLEVSAVDLRLVVDSVLESVRLAADSKRIELRQRVDRSAAIVTGDATRLHQVVSNLVTNAVKFTPAGGWVEVRLERAGDLARIAVQDNGIGISPEFLPHVFERFRQGDGSSTRSHGGLGLGLAIVRHLVDLHGGTVRAESAGEGRGSTFTVEIPLIRPSVAEDEADAVTRAALHDAMRPLSGVRVLVVDDESDSRDLILYLLEQAGAAVTTAASAAEALEVVDTITPDVLVSDIGMAQHDGYTLLRLLRERQSRSANVPAVAVSAYARAEDRQRALAAGFGAYVSKPIAPKDLVSSVERLAIAARKP